LRVAARLDKAPISDGNSFEVLHLRAMTFMPQPAHPELARETREMIATDEYVNGDLEALYAIHHGESMQTTNPNLPETFDQTIEYDGNWRTVSNGSVESTMALVRSMVLREHAAGVSYDLGLPIGLLENALDAHPEDLEVMSRLINLYIETGQFYQEYREQAQQVVEEMWRIAPCDGRTLDAADYTVRNGAQYSWYPTGNDVTLDSQAISFYEERNEACAQDATFVAVDIRLGQIEEWTPADHIRYWDEVVSDYPTAENYWQSAAAYRGAGQSEAGRQLDEIGDQLYRDSLEQ
jgi:hypothetical protein